MYNVHNLKIAMLFCISGFSYSFLPGMVGEYIAEKQLKQRYQGYLGLIIR